MNFLELIIFLLVTGGVGELIGGIVGLLTSGFTKGVMLGSLFGSVVAGSIITIVVFIKKRMKDSVYCLRHYDESLLMTCYGGTCNIFDGLDRNAVLF